MLLCYVAYCVFADCGCVLLCVIDLMWCELIVYGLRCVCFVLLFSLVGVVACAVSLVFAQR